MFFRALTQTLVGSQGWGAFAVGHSILNGHYVGEPPSFPTSKSLPDDLIPIRDACLSSKSPYVRVASACLLTRWGVTDAYKLLRSELVTFLPAMQKDDQVPRLLDLSYGYPPDQVFAAVSSRAGASRADVAMAALTSPCRSARDRALSRTAAGDLDESVIPRLVKELEDPGVVADVHHVESVVHALEVIRFGTSPYADTNMPGRHRVTGRIDPVLAREYWMRKH